MSKTIWLAIPSKRTPEEIEPVRTAWSERGYKIAMACDSPAEAKQKEFLANLVISSPDGYRGYARTLNALCEFLLINSDAQWIVAAGDDMLPDPNKSAEEIAAGRKRVQDLFNRSAPRDEDDWGQGAAHGAHRRPDDHHDGRDARAVGHVERHPGCAHSSERASPTRKAALTYPESARAGLQAGLKFGAVRTPASSMRSSSV